MNFLYVVGIIVGIIALYTGLTIGIAFLIAGHDNYAKIFYSLDIRIYSLYYCKYYSTKWSRSI